MGLFLKFRSNPLPPECSNIAVWPEAVNQGGFRSKRSETVAARWMTARFETLSFAPAFSGSPKTPGPSRRPEASDKKSTDSMQIASSLRDDHRGRISGSYTFHTIVKVGLKRLEDLLDDTAPTVSEEAVSSAIRSVEGSLFDGLQRFPDDSYLLTSEAQLATLLKDSARATSAIRSAFEANPVFVNWRYLHEGPCEKPHPGVLDKVLTVLIDTYRPLNPRGVSALRSKTPPASELICRTLGTSTPVTRLAATREEFTLVVGDDTANPDAVTEQFVEVVRQELPRAR